MTKANPDAISIDVGLRLRTLRKERNLSIRALARQSGISANALSMIERGRSSPSVSTLYKVTQALEISITTFFEEQDERSDVVFIQRSARTRVPFPRGLWEGLGGEKFSGRVEPFALTLESGASSGPHPITHAGHEFACCLRGHLEYQVEDKYYQLAAGDSLLFCSYLPHRWRNPGPLVTEVIFVLSGFGEGEALSKVHLTSSQVENMGAMTGENDGYSEDEEEPV